MSEEAIFYDPQTQAEQTTVTITLKLDTQRDATALQKLRDVPDVSEYILSLIRRDISDGSLLFR